MRQSSYSRSLLLIGVWANRNWILGNWIKEVHFRNRDTTRIHWVASVFAKKHWWENFVKYPLPKSRAYFFPYPSIFESYLHSNESKYRLKSIVNYTHNLSELGSISHQVKVLNQAFSVHFNCSSDANVLIENGLDSTKVRITLGAVDEDCVRDVQVDRKSKSVLLASIFSERKGLSILPDVIAALPEWNFIILGRGWDTFLKDHSLLSKNNVEYHYFNKKNRNLLMSQASIFLSLSTLEGGPMPLLESMSMGVVPVVTDTGFARDVITNGQNGIIISNPPELNEIIEAIKLANSLPGSPETAVKDLNWSRIANIIMCDSENIFQNEKNDAS